MVYSESEDLKNTSDDLAEQEEQENEKNEDDDEDDHEVEYEDEFTQDYDAEFEDELMQDYGVDYLDDEKAMDEPQAEISTSKIEEAKACSASSMEMQVSDEDFGECTQHNQHLIMIRLTQAQQLVQAEFMDVEKKRLADLGSGYSAQMQSERISQEYDQYRGMMEQMPAKYFTKEGCLALHGLISRRLNDLTEQIASLLKDEG